MAGNRDSFKAMLPLQDGLRHDAKASLEDMDSQFDEYLRLLAKNGEWGGEPEIIAIAQHYEIPIDVHQEDGHVINYNGGAKGIKAIIGYSKEFLHYYSVKTDDLIDNFTDPAVAGRKLVDIAPPLVDSLLKASPMLLLLRLFPPTTRYFSLHSCDPMLTYTFIEDALRFWRRQWYSDRLHTRLVCLHYEGDEKETPQDRAEAKRNNTSQEIQDIASTSQRS